MPSPALVVGVGGTGALVATYVKKELMETSGGVWPLKEVKVISFDTDKKQPELGAQGQVRGHGQTTGAVALSNGEFFFTGGNVRTLMEEVARGKHPHLGGWLLADWYLGTLSDKVFNLNEGAGQFRQFGRLAVFKDVATPANSIIFNTLNDALVKLSRDNPQMTSLQVFVISSLAGGTGAGMFADIAYLIRKIAEQSSVNLKDKMTIRGYLALPDAFSQTVDHAWLRSMHARAFAAMRENRRFTVSFDYGRGYPIYYHKDSGNAIWHGSLKGKLFDLLYYLDGNGVSRLNATDIKRGLAPMIADAVSAAIDKESGPKFATYVANVEAERLNRITRGEISKKTATFGAVGTYSVVFPIYQIVETWTHQLGLTLLKDLTKPDMGSVDKRSGVPLALLSNANQENPGEDGKAAALKFLRANQPLTGQERDEQNGLRTIQVEPSLLFGELGRIAEAANRPGNAIQSELAGRTITEWAPIFYPQAEDRETERLKTRIQNTLDMRLYDKEGKVGAVIASDQQKPKKEDPEQGVERLKGEVLVYKKQQLGEEDSRTGQRAGGKYRDALGQIAEYQIARFKLYLDVFTQLTLNGSPNRPALESRSGKIGYLLDFTAALKDLLIRAQDTLLTVQKSRRERGDSRRNAIAETKTAFEQMKSLAGKKTLLGGPAGEAFSAQHSYLQAESHLVGILQAEATEDAIIETVTRMIEYVESARLAVQGWAQSLVFGQDSLYAGLMRGMKQVESDRAAEEDLRSRHVIRDEKYEMERYETYLAKQDGGWLSYLLKSLTWEVRTKQVGGKPRMELALTVNTANPKEYPIDDQQADQNLATWLKLCRQPFVAAREEESVIGYLLQNPEYKDSTKLAEMLHKKGGVSLSFDGGNPLPANFLRAYFQDEEESNHRAYLRSVIQELSQLSGRSTVVADSEKPEESKFAQFTNSEDRFKLTLTYTQELVELEKIAAYEQGKSVYLSDGDTAAKGDRRVLHIFPAEVHAAAYESRLPELNQQLRLFSDDVALQMEDMTQLKLFLMCYVHGLVKRVSEKDRNKENILVFKLFVTPENEKDQFGNQAKTQEIWLTAPGKKATLLDAAMTFNFIGKDVGHGDSYVQEINYDAVRQALLRERNADAKSRVSQSDLSRFNFNKDLLQSVQAIRDEKRRKETLTMLANIERVSEMRQRFEQEILPFYAKSLGNPDIQKDYDLASVFLLMLNDEVKMTRQAIKDQINALHSAGEISKENLPPQSPEDVPL